MERRRLGSDLRTWTPCRRVGSSCAASISLALSPFTDGRHTPPAVVANLRAGRPSFWSRQRRVYGGLVDVFLVGGKAPPEWYAPASNVSSSCSYASSSGGSLVKSLCPLLGCRRPWCSYPAVGGELDVIFGGGAWSPSMLPSLRLHVRGYMSPPYVVVGHIFLRDKLSMGKFEHGNLLVSLSEGHRHGYSLAAVAVGLGIGVAGLCKALHSSLVIPWVSWKFFSESERVYYAGGLKNLGNNCFLNVILQALASCDRFVSSLDDLLGSDGLLPEEQPERMPLIFALSSLLKDLSIVRDERTVLNPQRVMHALSFYVSHFNLTRQQDASEAFLHLLTSLRDEFSRCYVPYRSSLADITVFHSKVYKQREGNQPECKRWKQNIFGPFDGTIGSTLSCRNCSSVLSLDFENFHCLPLSPVLDINGDIINGCSLVDCLKHFTVLEHLDNYRCDRCWHNAAAKYFSLTSEVDEEKVNKLRSCVDYDSCSCRHIFGPEEIKWSVSSKATKQLAITHCPKILCIHLLRASISLHGELVKREGHISFPLLLNLSPFAGGAFSTGQGPGPSSTNMQRHDQPSLHLYRQNVQMAVNMFPTGGESSQLRKDEATNGYGYSLYKANVDVARSSLSSSSSLSRNKLYSLSAVVEHYGVCGGGHYAAYRRVTPNCDANHLVRSLGEQWLYISDDHVSQVSEGDVLGAEATLLFYERL